MSYSTAYVAKKLDISKDTLRYYEKEGLLPFIERDSSGHRAFSDDDIDWVFLVRCLRDTDMPIHKIKKYVTLLKESGGQSIPERREILFEHSLFLKEKILMYQNLSKLIDKKLDFYDEVINNNKTDVVSCTDYAAEWEHFKTLLGGIHHD